MTETKGAMMMMGTVVTGTKGAMMMVMGTVVKRLVDLVDLKIGMDEAGLTRHRRGGTPDIHQILNLPD